jgi:hypothetical protein
VYSAHLLQTPQLEAAAQALYNLQVDDGTVRQSIEVDDNDNSDDETEREEVYDSTDDGNSSVVRLLADRSWGVELPLLEAVRRERERRYGGRHVGLWACFCVECWGYEGWNWVYCARHQWIAELTEEERRWRWPRERD